MNTNEHPDYDDVGEALQEGRPLRPARNYRIRYAQGDLNFRDLEVNDPVPLGRQILAAAGVDPAHDYSLFAILQGGDFEDVRLDEPFDLRERGAERFVAFQTDRDFKLTLGDHQLEWGKPAINGTALYTLAKPNHDEAVFLDMCGGEDRLIETTDLIDLTAPGVERFYVGKRPVVTVVNEDDGRVFKLAGNKHTLIEELITKMYAELRLPPRADDRLRCEEGGKDVFQFRNLTLGKYIEAGHCRCLVWLFAGGTGGASCQ